MSPRRPPRPVLVAAPLVHALHDVRVRGYVERPGRIAAIERGLAVTGLFERIGVRRFGEEPLRAVHDPAFLAWMRAVCEGPPAPVRPVYPYALPPDKAGRGPCRLPRDPALRAGWYAIDTFTPLDRNAWRAARAAADTALTAADAVLRGRPAAYALCRPPGHHAGRRVYGGFCYLNNAAAAAQRLSESGRVALLDLDFHHGNGGQDIFWRRPDVLTISIHGHPASAYPYFRGFADEVGEGRGRGANRNFALPGNARGKAWLAALDEALDLIRRHRSAFVVTALGYDTMKGDPTGSFALSPAHMRAAGARLAGLGLPLVIVQEGGYNLRNLRAGAKAFAGGLAGR